MLVKEATDIKPQQHPTPRALPVDFISLKNIDYMIMNSVITDSSSVSLLALRMCRILIPGTEIIGKDISDVAASSAW